MYIRIRQTAYKLFVVVFMTGFLTDLYPQTHPGAMNLPHYDYRPYHFGFLLGFNKMDFALKPVEDLHSLNMDIPGHNFDTIHSVLAEPEYGFNIGIVSNLKLGPKFDLRFVPTLSFGDRNIVYEGISKDGRSMMRSQKIESTFLDFPLFVKYKSVRMHNTRVYVIGGFRYSHDLASAEDKEDPDADVIATTYRDDFYYELGVGFDHYFYYFKFSTEIKASFGIRDILKRENTVYTNSIDRLNSQIIQLSFLFE